MATIMQYWFRLYDALLGRWLLILDYDRTIFDTDQYFRLFKIWLSAVRPDLLAPLTEAEAAGEFDPFAFVAERTGQKQSQLMEQFREWLRANHPAVDLLRSDARQFLAWAKRQPRLSVVIVTTGTEAHQRFKLSLVPEVAGIPFRIVSGNKGQHIQDEHFNNSGFGFELCGRAMRRFILIDDKRSSLSPINLLAANTLLILIERDDSKPSEDELRRNISPVRDLMEAPALIKQALRRH